MGRDPRERLPRRAPGRGEDGAVVERHRLPDPRPPPDVFGSRHDWLQHPRPRPQRADGRVRLLRARHRCRARHGRGRHDVHRGRLRGRARLPPGHVGLDRLPQNVLRRRKPQVPRRDRPRGRHARDRLRDAGEAGRRPAQQHRRRLRRRRLEEGQGRHCVDSRRHHHGDRRGVRGHDLRDAVRRGGRRGLRVPQPLRWHGRLHRHGNAAGSRGGHLRGRRQPCEHGAQDVDGGRGDEALPLRRRVREAREDRAQGRQGQWSPQGQCLAVQGRHHGALPGRRRAQVRPHGRSPRQGLRHGLLHRQEALRGRQGQGRRHRQEVHHQGQGDRGEPRAPLPGARGRQVRLRLRRGQQVHDLRLLQELQRHRDKEALPHRLGLLEETPDRRAARRHPQGARRIHRLRGGRQQRPLLLPALQRGQVRCRRGHSHHRQAAEHQEDH